MKNSGQLSVLAIASHGSVAAIGAPTAVPHGGGNNDEVKNFTMGCPSHD